MDAAPFGAIGAFLRDSRARIALYAQTKIDAGRQNATLRCIGGSVVT
jgi:hypothetical protein